MLEFLVVLLFLAGILADLTAKPGRKGRNLSSRQPQGPLEPGVGAQRQWDDDRALAALGVLMLAEDGVFFPGTDEVFDDDP